MTGRQVGIAALGALVALAFGAGTASAAKVENGNFERGNLSGWQQTYYPNPDDPFGEWFIYGDMMRPDARRGGFPLPPQGQFGAVTDQQEVSGQILSQVVDLKPGKRHKLRFELAYQNPFAAFFTPHTLGLGTENQQFRMDVMKPNAPIKSVKNKHVLERVYQTEPGDPEARGFRTITANLTPYAGKEVRLRFAVAVTEKVLNVGIDAVKVKTKPN